MVIRYDDKGKYFTDLVSKEAVSVLIQTRQHRLQGQFYVRPEERLKDALDRPEPFLALTDVTVFELDGSILYQSGFVAVSKVHIEWAAPLEELLSFSDSGKGEG